MWNTIADRLEDYQEGDDIYSKESYLFENKVSLTGNCFLCEYVRHTL